MKCYLICFSKYIWASFTQNISHDSCSSFVKHQTDQSNTQIRWDTYEPNSEQEYHLHSRIVFFSFLFFSFLWFRQIVYQLSRATSSECSQEIFSHHIIACPQSSSIWYIFVFPVTAAVLYNKNQINTCLSVFFICRHSYCFWNDFHAWKITLWSNRNYFHGHALFCNLFGGRSPNCIN